MPEEIKLFGKWSYKGIEVRDPGLRRYINLKPVYLPHTGGRHEHKKFGKADVPIVERLVNKMMSPGLVKRTKGLRDSGEASGKKARAIKIVERAFELIHLKTGRNPIEVLIRALENSAPREEDTRIIYGGITYRQAADCSPQRRLDLALRFIAEAAWRGSFSSTKTIEESLADEIIAAAQNSSSSFAVRKKDEKERIALSAR